MSEANEASNKMHKTYVWVDEELKQKLKAEAAQLPPPYNSVSHLIRTIINEHYKSHEQAS